MDTETVAQAATDTVNAKLSVDGNLARLKALCDELASSWSGQGAAAFANVMQAWDIEAAKLLDALQDIADSLDASSAAQAEMDAESNSEFGAFDGEL
ncbi:WXG100 family type VII secretion target [Glycomyces tritici]|uniref:ESAT-6-like protein n=1 Tax=Glycomyces tritici TaxID=2665176 RepID=A0ABT7YWH3_9ACTN|nr:WXG100 family type VII secretion target [Glycomyces tritici]MDN3242998.1 WXG100 family type VII secretion target [Glycomyces tritici]